MHLYNECITYYSSLFECKSSKRVIKIEIQLLVHTLVLSNITVWASLSN